MIPRDHAEQEDCRGLPESTPISHEEAGAYQSSCKPSADGVSSASVNLESQFRSWLSAKKRLTARGVFLSLKTSLYLYFSAIVYVTAVRVASVISAAVRIAELPGDGTRGNPDDLQPAYMIAVLYACDGVSVLLLGSLTALLTLVAANHIKAVSATEGLEQRAMAANHLQRAVLYLSAIFNTFSVSVAFHTLLDVVTATNIYPLISTPIAISLAVVSLFWVLGFAVMRLYLWRKSDPGTNTPHVIELLSGSPKEMTETPVIIRIWLNQVFGRTEFQRMGIIGVGRQEVEVELEQAYTDIKFTPAQNHILHLLLESMRHVGMWLVFKVYTGLLLMASYVALQSWREAASVAVEIIKSTLAMSLIFNGAILFTRALWANDSSDISNMIRGFSALANTLKRLTIMFIVTTSLQIVAFVTGAAVE